MIRRVSGVLFADYVRMIRGNKGIDWSRHLTAEDVQTIAAKIDPTAWYPMESFERLGNAILREVTGGDLGAVRRWGRFSVVQLRAKEPMLVAPGDPVETLMRFRVHRSTFFDFEALEIESLVEGHAEIVIHYFMGPVAEEAASYQTLGFFEELLDAAGASGVLTRFSERSWAGDARTLLVLDWATRR